MLKTIEALMLVSALSLDAFAASFGFGTEKIKIPFSSTMIISTICSLLLTVSLLAGSYVKQLIPQNVTIIISFTILLILAIMRLLDSYIKNLIKKSYSNKADIKFKFMSFEFILNIYADSTIADKDNSRTLSAAEAASLAVALSLDGIAAGFGAGISHVSYIEIIFFSFLTGILAVTLGSFIGRKIANKTELNLSWLSGVVLILLAVSKLIF